MQWRMPLVQREQKIAWHQTLWGTSTTSAKTSSMRDMTTLAKILSYVLLYRHRYSPSPRGEPREKEIFLSLLKQPLETISKLKRSQRK
jgi:hypothetical protein